MLICIIQTQCSRIQRSEPDEANKESGQGAAEGGKNSKPDSILIANFEKYAGELSPKEFLNIFKKVVKF